MIPLLIIQPTTCESDIKRPPPKRIDREFVPRNSQNVDGLNRDEEAYAFKLITWFFVLLILPAMLTLLYIALNPEAFIMDMTPQIDFSTWQPGQRP